MKGPRNIHRPYTVEIVADAWGQVSHLPRDTYRALQARLESLAVEPSEHVAMPGEGTPEEVPSFRMDHLTIHYVVDARRRLIRLMRISRERSTPVVSRPQAEESPSS